MHQRPHKNVCSRAVRNNDTKIKWSLKYFLKKIEGSRKRDEI